ncbi:HAD family hydrolase [Dactylosporangium sp. CA-092794]|uniref:HAD family hydrolase n=1 Tax=Dactylosporangium sp. CA-092794 TaxID=3239929 RepID=UPI003D91B51B
MLQAVCFDYFNTCTSAVRRGNAHRRTAEVLGVDPAAWVELLDRTYDERIRGAYGGHFAGLRRLCTELGVEPTTAQLRAAVELRRAALRDDAPLRPETIPVLRALRAAGVRIAIVSDCWFELPLYLPCSPLAGVYDVAVYSVQVGHAKPHPAMYATACDLLDVDPGRCLYVGDGGGRELTGAARYGLTAVQLQAPDLGEHLTFDAEPDWRGAAVESLAEVLELVRAIRRVSAPMLVA